MARTPFTLKSGNATAFKNMGSYSPMKADATTTTKKTGLGKLLGDVKSLVQNVGGKLKEGKKAADDRKKEQKEKDKARTGLDRMERRGKSQYQLDQMDAALEAMLKKKKAAIVTSAGDGTGVITGATGDGTGIGVGAGAGAVVGAGAGAGAVTNRNIEETAEEVIRGKYGDGKKRKKALGSNYNAVQALVNEIIRRKK